ncbi:MAG: ATP-binding protein [Myxococcota bacterium]|nr:ATP-binding protein [Myxococcota bacterium]
MSEPASLQTEPASLQTEPELELAEEQRRLRVLTIVTLAILAMGPFFIYQYASMGIPSVSIAVVATMGAAGLNLAWARRGAGSRAGGWVATALFFALLIFSNWNSGGFYDPNFGWFYFFPILAALLVDARAGWTFTGIIAATIAFFWIAPQYGIEIPNNIPAEHHAEQSLANRLSAILAIGIVLAAISSHERFSRALLQRSNKSLQGEIERRAATQERLIRTERAASVGGLAAGLAHEINNPLTYVIGNLDLLQEQLRTGTARDPAVRDRELLFLASEALEGSQRVASLVQDLSTFSHIDDASVGPVDLAVAIEHSVRLVANEIRHRATFDVDCEPGLRVLGSEGQVQQVLVNLLVNAAHSIEPGSVEQNRIRVSARPRYQRILIEVSDTGCGINPETLGRIFEPFFTTKASGSGTGMGLSITRNVLDVMGGSITVESSLGIGSTFSVWLNPVAADTPEVSPKTELPAGSLAPERELRILIVDDEHRVLRYLRDALSHHQVCTEGNAKTALERILREDHDVILCDLMMPEMTGMDLYAEVQRDRPEAAQRMLFMTAGTFVERQRDFLTSVSDRWIEKPFEIAELERRIQARAEATPPDQPG